MELGTETRTRWYGGAPVEGARFRRGDGVEIADGDHAGERAEVLVLERLDPPTYLLRLASGMNLMILEGALRPLAAPGDA